MANTTYGIKEGMLVAEQQTGARKTVIVAAELRGKLTGEGPLPAEVMPALMIAASEAVKPLTAVFDFSRQKPQEFRVIDSLIASGKLGRRDFHGAAMLTSNPDAFEAFNRLAGEGNPESLARARLLVAVAGNPLYRGMLEDALITVMEEQVDIDGMRNLTQRIQTDRVSQGELPGELAGLIPKPTPEPKPEETTHKPEEIQPPKPEETTQEKPGEAQTPKPEEAQPKPKEAQPPKPRERTENELREDFVVARIEEAFKQEASIDRALAACAGFTSRLGNEEWQSIFQAVANISSTEEGERIQYLEHMLRHAEHIPLYSNLQRVEAAASLVHSVYYGNGQRSDELRHRAFQAAALAEPADFSLLTGPGNNSIRSMAGMQETGEQRASMLEHMLSREDPERNFLRLCSDESRVNRARQMMAWLNDLGVTALVEQAVKARGGKATPAEAFELRRTVDRQDIQRNIFTGLFMRPAEVFAQLTEETPHAMLESMAVDGRVMREVGDFATPLTHVVLRYPEVLAGIAQEPQAIPSFVREVSTRCSEGRRYLETYFTAMLQDARYAERLTSPEAVRQTIAILEHQAEIAPNLSPELIVHPDTMMMSETTRERELRKMSAQANGQQTAAEEHEPETREPRGPRERVEERPEWKVSRFIEIHGERVVNPQFAITEYPPELGRFLLVPNMMALGRSELQKLRDAHGPLPYAEQIIVNILSNTSQTDFQTPAGRIPGFELLPDRLLSIMSQDRILMASGQYTRQTGPANMAIDLRELERKGYCYRTPEGTIRLREQVILIGDTPPITQRAEAELKRMLDDAIRGHPTDVQRRQLFETILLSIARSPAPDRPNYMADIDAIAAQCTGHPRAVVERAVERLEKGHGLLMNPHHGRGVRILNPMFVIMQIASDTGDMKIPAFYETQYPHLMRFNEGLMRMYRVAFSLQNPAHVGFHQDLQMTGPHLDKAIELITTRGRGANQATNIEIDLMDRRKTEVRTLTKISLDIDHGGKREVILGEAKKAGLKANEDMLAALLKAGILIQPRLGYYELNDGSQQADAEEGARQNLLRASPTQLPFASIRYERLPDQTTYQQFHPNVDEAKMTGILTRTFNGTRAGEMLPLVKLISHQHRHIKHGGTLDDLWLILQMERPGNRVYSKEQVGGDLEALTHGIQPQSALDSRGRETVLPGCPAVIRKRDFSPSEVYWQVNTPGSLD